MNQLGLMFQLLLSDHVQKHHIYHLMVTLQLLRTIHLIILPNHQVQIPTVLNHHIKLVHIHLTMMDQYMIILYLVVDVEGVVDVGEAVDLDQVVEVEGVMGHIVPHHQVVIHHTEDMPGTVGVGGHLLE